jgi:hypothetical protein
MARRQTVRLRSHSLLTELVRAKGFTVRDMADRLPCGKSMVHALMTGEKQSCSAYLGERIAEVVGVPTAVLFAPAVSKNVAAPSTDVAA